MKFLFFIVALGFSLTGFSQSKDYLVKVNGDTIRGNIVLRDMIFYVGDTDPVLVSADEVRKIKSARYKGSDVVHCKLQLYTDNLQDLELDWIKKGVTDTIMILENIYTTPKINLYFGMDNFKTQYYFYKTPSDSFPVQLVVRYYLQGGLDNYGKDRAKYKGERSKMNIVEDKGYVNQLHAIMGKCKKISERMWELLAYRDYSLKEVIKKYNQCK
jgi:hypothetical protein